MRSFIRLSVSLFVLGLFIFIFAYIFSPEMRDRFKGGEASFGTQTPPLTSPGQQAPPARAPAQEGGAADAQEGAQGAE